MSNENKNPKMEDFETMMEARIRENFNAPGVWSPPIAS